MSTLSYQWQKKKKQQTDKKTINFIQMHWNTYNLING